MTKIGGAKMLRFICEVPYKEHFNMHHLYQICKSGHILELLKEKLIFKLFTIQVSV